MAPIEIAAKAAIAIRIGTKGEDESSSEALSALRGCPGWVADDCCVPVPLSPAFVPLPGLPWPVPPSPPEPGLAATDEPSEEDPELEAPEPFGAVAPPLAEDFADELCFFGGLVFPVTVGTSVSYTGPTDSSA